MERLDELLHWLGSSRCHEEHEPKLDLLARRLGAAATTYADMAHIPLSGEPEPYFHTSLGTTFTEPYAKGGFAGFDPVIRKAAVTSAPFTWMQVPEYALHAEPRPGVKGRIRQLAELALDHRYVDGLVVPCHALDASGRPVSALVSLYWQGPIDDLLRAVPAWFRLAALIYHERRVALMNLSSIGSPSPNTPVLTDRERECLIWACRGKTNGDTAEIIGVSERTVEFHTRNAMRKLGVYSKVHAVALAMRLGLVTP